MTNATLEGFGFQAGGSAHPLEDRLQCDWLRGVLAVADGVTRPSYGADAEAESARVGAVAALFCASAVEGLAAEPVASPAAALRQVCVQANRRIHEMNTSWGLEKDDYDLRDPYATVGACGILSAEGMLHFGFIGDVMIRIADEPGGLRLLSEDQLTSTRRVLDEQRFPTLEARFDFVRRNLRNRSREHPGAYGVLNGDPRGEVFWTTGSVALNAGSAVILHTDGAEELVESAGFQEIVQRFRDGASPVAAKAEAIEMADRLRAGSRSGAFDDLTVVMARRTAAA